MDDDKLRRERASVRTMAAYGVPVDDIAAVLGTTAADIRIRFSADLIAAPIEANAKVAETLFKSAMDGNVLAMEIWLKQRAGWF